MVIEYEVKSNVFSFLSGKPKAWQLLFNSSVVLNKGDTVRLVELDENNEPTGVTKDGTIVWLHTEVNSITITDLKLVHVIPD